MFPYMNEMFALLSTVLLVVGYASYFKTLFSGKTVPHFFTWFVWAVLTGIAFVAQWSDGGGVGSLVMFFTLLVTVYVAIYAFFKGEKDYTRGDWLSLCAAFIGITIWLHTNDALWAVIIITIVDAVSFYPTFRKSYHKPYSENAFTFFTQGMKFIFMIIALENYTWVTVLYPTSLVLINLLFVALLLVRRRQIAMAI